MLPIIACYIFHFLINVEAYEKERQFLSNLTKLLWNIKCNMQLTF